MNINLKRKMRINLINFLAKNSLQIKKKALKFLLKEIISNLYTVELETGNLPINRVKLMVNELKKQ